MILHYLKIALRNLWKYKSQTLVGVLGLTMACVVFALCCYPISLVLFDHTSIPHHERVYNVETHSNISIYGDMSQTFNELSGVEKITAYSTFNPRFGRMLTEENEPGRQIRFTLHEADTSYFDFFGLKLLKGNVSNILNTTNSIVLYETDAKKIGAIDSLMGRSILIDDVAYTITGILKNKSTLRFNFTGFVFNAEKGMLKQNREEWSPRTSHIVVRLNKGVTQESFQTTLDAYPFAIKANDGADEKNRIFITPVSERRNLPLKAYFPMMAVFLVGFLVLFAALFNIISFQMAQFYNRLRESAIRKVMGSGKMQLFLSFYVEICIIFILSSILGLFVLDFLKPLLTQPWLAILFADNAIAGLRQSLLLSVLFGLFITFLFCLVPVQIISRQSIRVAFTGISEKVSKQRGRKIMLFVQMFILLIFLSCTLIVSLQVSKVKENIWHTLSAKDRKNILVFYHSDKWSSAPSDVILQKFKQLTTIDDVSFSNSTFSLANYVGKSINNYDHTVREYMVSDNFADFFNVKRIHGRFWNENDPPDVIVADETFAALFPDNNPLGMIVDGKTIIGVLENVQMNNAARLPVFYSRVDNMDFCVFYVKAIAGNRKKVQQQIKQIQKEFFHELDNDIGDFQMLVDDSFRMENGISFVSSIVSAICLTLCLLSIYSAILMNTAKRRKEVAIRKINGAEIKNIILLFSKTYFWLWSMVCLLSFPLIYFVGNKWLETFNQWISLNIFFFSGIYFSVLLLIFLIIIFRILEVARCNPARVVVSD